MAQMSDEMRKLRDRLNGQRGRQYWRSLDELAQSPEFEDVLRREFPREASVLDALGRRSFLKVMGASLALAGLSGCGTESVGKIVPYVNEPELIAAGESMLSYTSAITLNGIATGVLVQCTRGRPVKIEGNPSHPASLGATDVFSQAAILSLYDPERAQTVQQRREVSTWAEFLDALPKLLDEQRPTQGAGLRILTETVTSPTLAAQLKRVQQQYPQAKWHQYEPINRDNLRAGAQAAFGEDVNAIYHFDKADVIVSLDADFLYAHPANLRAIRDYISRKRVREGQKNLNRLYVFESALSTTGSMSDHHWAMKSGDLGALAQELASNLGVQNMVAETAHRNGTTISEHDFQALVKDLQQHRGSSLVLAGNEQPAAVHALAHAINHALGNAGKTVTYTAPLEENSVAQLDSLRELTDDLNAGKVDLLFVLGGDPLYTAPADFKFEQAYQKARNRIHMSLYPNATSGLSQWHIPQAHELECWSDARTFDGSVTIQQPVILPLYNGQSMLELVARIAGDTTHSSHDLVRAYWHDKLKDGDPNAAWHKALSEGIVHGSAREARDNLSIKGNLPAPPAPASPASSANGGLELNIRPDPSIWDGRFVNNAWLQELPKPITKLTWDNAVLIAPETAKKLGVGNQDVVELQLDGRSVSGAIWITPGQATDALTIHLGYGQSVAGRVGLDTGFNAYALRASTALHTVSNVAVRKTGATYPLACTQGHFLMEGRKLIIENTIDAYLKDPDFIRKEEEEPQVESLYRDYNYGDGYAWGMVIDTTACVGCNACILACQSENNIPVVGKEQVIHGREMHWLRVDRYYSGDLANPQSSFQPVPCMHCENAPCEPVCPVHATTHSAEGLNEMTYNRCIGTRYCSNNCPYKVRRFNFLQYTDMSTPAARLQYNPDVSVRERGVMEKCTYCVQRITHARITSEKENRRVRDSEVTPACAQSCPSEAIIFGDLNDRNTRVRKLKETPLNYGLLQELNTRPRTTYLARIRNPNPEIVSAGAVPAPKPAF